MPSRRRAGFCVKGAQHRRRRLALDAGSRLAQASISEVGCEGRARVPMFFGEPEAILNRAMAELG